MISDACLRLFSIIILQNNTTREIFNLGRYGTGYNHIKIFIHAVSRNNYHRTHPRLFAALCRVKVR